MQKKHAFTALLFVALVLAAYGHNPDSGHLPLRKWHLSHHRHLHASFLMMRHDSVVLELESGATRALPLASLSAADRDFVRAQEEKIERLNQRARAVQPSAVTPQPSARPAASGGWAWVVAALLGSAVLAVFLTKKRSRWAFASVLTGSAILLAFRPVLLGTDPHFVDAAFKPFKPHVATHWDGTWFYVESKGIPTTHSMMRGITKWQQQVPIPQCYIGANAWQIPLNPELADQPVPVNPQHFIRGAIAIATNGVPIFNPYTNTGVDALVDGQLDEWGGHSGRADDYHYHIAPLHLDTQTMEVLPIAFGLDGFAVYGPLEPDGSAMLPLDSHHGHFDAAGVYHYHGTPQAPYMIGDMVGKVTEDATMQIVPQSKAMPVRPSLTPLTGATITDFQPKTGGNGYVLTYTRNGQTFQVDYDWTTAGLYTYRFVSPTGTSVQTYNGQAPCQVPTATAEAGPADIELNVYPNPSSGEVYLQLSGADVPAVRSLQVFDLKGQILLQVGQPRPLLPLGGLPQGVYLLRLSSDKGDVSRKVIIQ